MNMKKVIGNIAFIAVFLIIITRFITIFNGVPYPMNIISSSSMKPSLHEGDIVIWMPCKIEDVREGDIVVYKSIYGNLIIHRVVDIKDGKLITKGDANNYTDQAGPHIPEPMVSERNLYGKAIMIGSQPLKIPFIGYFWIYLQKAIDKMATPINWGKPQPALHYLIFSPFIFFLTILMAYLIVWLPNGKNLKEKLHELIFGPEKITVKKMMGYIFSFFIPFLLLTSFFAYDSIVLDEHKNKVVAGIPVYNPSLLPVRGIVFVEGNKNITLDSSIFAIKSGERKEIGVTYAKDIGGKVFVYSSPYWMLLPEKVIEYFYNMNPRVCILFSSLLSSLIMSFITLLLLIFSSIFIEKFHLTAAYMPAVTMKHYPKFLFLYQGIAAIKNKINKVEEKIRNMLLWVDTINKKAIFIPLITIVFIPLLFDGIGNLFLIAFISSMVISISLYHLGCRFKNEFAFASFISSSILSFVFAARMLFFLKDGAVILFMQYLSISFILIIILFIVNFMTMMAFVAVLHRVREKMDPAALLEVCDI